MLWVTSHAQKRYEQERDKNEFDILSVISKQRPVTAPAATPTTASIAPTTAPTTAPTAAPIVARKSQSSPTRRRDPIKKKMAPNTSREPQIVDDPKITEREDHRVDRQERFKSVKDSWSSSNRINRIQDPTHPRNGLDAPKITEREEHRIARQERFKMIKKSWSLTS
jgi:hypothetical protein